MKVFKVWLTKDSNPYVVKAEDLHLRMIEEDISVLEPGDSMKIECLYMAEEEFSKLKEFTGP